MSFTEEDRSFLWEKQDCCQDRIERDAGNDEEKSTVSVRNTLQVTFKLLENDICKYCSCNLTKDPHNQSIRESDNVVKRSF
jgi:hypothetical protein